MAKMKLMASPSVFRFLNLHLLTLLKVLLEVKVHIIISTMGSKVPGLIS
jgi:hypothetical protein